MSMPTFPECPDITREKAFDMILASIAMEELALSHIINAEGEKLQFVLGTLPGCSGSCASVSEVLAVNKSINSLLDSVAQNQMFLKSKMEKLLEFCPAPEAEKPRHFGHSPTESCATKEYAMFLGPARGYYWKTAEYLPWQNCCNRETNIIWENQYPEMVQLGCGTRYEVRFTVILDRCTKPPSVVLTNLACGQPIFMGTCCPNAYSGGKICVAGRGVIEETSTCPVTIGLLSHGATGVTVQQACLSVWQI